MSFPEVSVSGCFPKVKTGQLDCGRISHFENEKRFFHEFVMKNHLLHTYYLGFDRFCWMILVSTGNSMIFGINTASDISNYLLYVISRAVRRLKFETILKYAKYHIQIMLLFAYTTTRKRFVIFTCRYFKLS